MEAEFPILFVMDDDLIISVRMKGYGQIQSRFLFPFFILGIQIKIMDSTIAICMFIVLCSCNGHFFYSLVIIQGKAITIAQVYTTVIAVIYMRQGHRHQTSVCIHGIMDHDQVSVVIIYMDSSCTTHFLAVISPVIFQTGIIHIGNVNPWTSVLESFRTVRRKKLCIFRKFIIILDHKTIIASFLIPVFYHSCDIHGDIFLFIGFKCTNIFDCIRIHWFVIPVDLS